MKGGAVALDAVRVLKEVVQKPGSIKLLVKKISEISEFWLWEFVKPCSAPPQII